MLFRIDSSSISAGHIATYRGGTGVVSLLLLQDTPHSLAIPHLHFEAWGTRHFGLLHNSLVTTVPSHHLILSCQLLTISLRIAPELQNQAKHSDYG